MRTRGFCDACNKYVHKHVWEAHFASRDHRFNVAKAQIIAEGVACEPPMGTHLRAMHIWCGVCEAAVGMGENDTRQWEQHVFGNFHQRVAARKAEEARQAAAREREAAGAKAPTPAEVLAAQRRRLKLDDTAMLLPPGASRPRRKLSVEPTPASSEGGPARTGPSAAPGAAVAVASISAESAADEGAASAVAASNGLSPATGRQSSAVSWRRSRGGGRVPVGGDGWWW